MKKLSAPKFWPMSLNIKPLTVKQVNLNMLRYVLPPEMVPIKKKVISGIVLMKKDNILMVRNNAKGGVDTYDPNWK